MSKEADAILTEITRCWHWFDIFTTIWPKVLIEMTKLTNVLIDINPHFFLFSDHAWIIDAI